MKDKLKKLDSFKGVGGPVLVVVMDGVGLAPPSPGNAVDAANTPMLDRLMANYPMVQPGARNGSGLPTDEDMGNSEVGHNALGSGQYAQGAKLVNQSLRPAKCTGQTHGASLSAMLGRATARCTLSASVRRERAFSYKASYGDDNAGQGRRRAPVRIHALLDGRDVGIPRRLSISGHLRNTLPGCARKILT